MIQLIAPDCYDFANELHAMHCLRFRLFKERLDWEVGVNSGYEIDSFDALHPYFCCCAVRPFGSMVVSDFCLRQARLCFATIPALWEGETAPEDPRIWEDSRFALDIASSAPKGAGSIAVGTYELFAGMIEFGLSRRLSRIVTLTDLHMERILRRAGWPLSGSESRTRSASRARWPAISKYRKRYCTWCGETVALGVLCDDRRSFAASHDLSTRLGRAG